MAVKLGPCTQQVGDYWGWFNKRSYHHTGPVSTLYAMREALALVAEEGVDNMWCVQGRGGEGRAWAGWALPCVGGRTQGKQGVGCALGREDVPG